MSKRMFHSSWVCWHCLTECIGLHLLEQCSYCLDLASHPSPPVACVGLLNTIKPTFCFPLYVCVWGAQMSNTEVSKIRNCLIRKKLTNEYFLITQPHLIQGGAVAQPLARGSGQNLCRPTCSGWVKIRTPDFIMTNILCSDWPKKQCKH